MKIENKIYTKKILDCFFKRFISYVIHDEIRSISIDTAFSDRSDCIVYYYQEYPKDQGPAAAYPYMNRHDLESVLSDRFGCIITITSTDPLKPIMETG